MEHTIRMSDAEMNRYLRAKLRELRPSEQIEKEPVKDEKPKKIAWGPVLKIDPKEIEPGPV
jgi:hypothetical protein